MSDATTPETRAMHATFHANAIGFSVSREEALMYGHAQATPEENADYHEWQRKNHAERVAAWKVYDAAVVALAAVEEPLARELLDLHAPKTEDHPTCTGCEFSGWEAEAPEWPCSTVAVIAKRYDVALPERHIDSRPPEVCTPTDYPTKPWSVRDLFPQSFATLDPIVFNGSHVAE